MAKPSLLRVLPKTGPTPGRMRTGPGPAGPGHRPLRSPRSRAACPVSDAILARNRLGARPMETRQAGLRLDPRSGAGSAAGRAAPPFSRSVPARSIQASSSDRVWISGVSSPTKPKMRFALGDVFGEVRLDDDGLGAGLQRLEHRHGRADAGLAGDIAGRSRPRRARRRRRSPACRAVRAGRASPPRRRRRRSPGGRWSADPVRGRTPRAAIRRPGSAPRRRLRSRNSRDRWRRWPSGMLS